MELNRYSKRVYSAVIHAFPELAEAESLEATQGCFSIRYPSPHADVELYISSEDDEITIAFGGWHEHIAMFEGKTEQEEIKEAIELIRSILSDELVVAYATVEGEWSGSWVVSDECDRKPIENEAISLRRWTRVA